MACGFTGRAWHCCRWSRPSQRRVATGCRNAPRRATRRSRGRSSSRRAAATQDRGAGSGRSGRSHARSGGCAPVTASTSGAASTRAHLDPRGSRCPRGTRARHQLRRRAACREGTALADRPALLDDPGDQRHALGSHEEQPRARVGRDYWVWENSEIWNSRAQAGLLIDDGADDDRPLGRFTVRRNCIHDTVPNAGPNQDHNIYVSDFNGSPRADGLIERNIMRTARNGQASSSGPATTWVGLITCCALQHDLQLGPEHRRLVRIPRHHPGAKSADPRQGGEHLVLGAAREEQRGARQRRGAGRRTAAKRRTLGPAGRRRGGTEG